MGSAQTCGWDGSLRITSLDPGNVGALRERYPPSMATQNPPSAPPTMVVAGCQSTQRSVLRSRDFGPCCTRDQAALLMGHSARPP